MSRRPEHLATGYVRMAGLLTLLTGIAVMHIFIAAHEMGHSTERFAAQSVTHRPTSPDITGRSESTATAELSPGSHEHRSMMAGVTSPSKPDTSASPIARHHQPSSIATLTSTTMPGEGMDSGCADGCCPMPGGTHACVFILTTLVLLLGLAFLGRVGDKADAATRTVRGRAARHARPPPWTTPSLAELSILRI